LQEKYKEIWERNREIPGIYGEIWRKHGGEIRDGRSEGNIGKSRMRNAERYRKFGGDTIMAGMEAPWRYGGEQGDS
jgi:hypothetical protein